MWGRRVGIASGDDAASPSLPGRLGQSARTDLGGRRLGGGPPEKVETKAMIPIRAKLLAFLTTGVAILSLGVVPSIASAETEEAPTPIEEGAVVPPGASVGVISPQALGDCPARAMCAWGDAHGGEYTPPLSWWPEESVGCHSHAGNERLYAFYNLTDFRVRLGGQGYIYYPEHFTVPFGVTGEICWGPGV
jgi:hypothetical protein